MKKTLSLALVILMVVVAFSVFTIGSSADDGWELDNNGKLTLSKDMKCDYDGNQNIDKFPWASKRNDIKEVVITDAVTTIFKGSFAHCDNLKKITTGTKCETIEMDAFAYCKALEEIVFGCPIKTFGQGVVFDSNAIKKVTLTNQTLEDFKVVSTVNSYNWKEKGGMETGFDKAVFTVAGDADSVVKLDVKPSQYGKIENWTGNTWFLVGGTTKEIAEQLKSGALTMKVVIVDETAKKTYTISKYAFDVDKGKEIYSDGTFLRLAVCHYGIVPVKDHKYTVTLEMYSGDTLKYKGTSAQGAFDTITTSTAANSTPPEGNDVWVVENPEHQYDEYQKPDVNPPAGGEHTAMIAVLAIVALFGSAVVVSKKVLSK